MAEKILNEEEFSQYLTAEDKDAFLLEKWTQKECIFKRSDERAYSPKQTNTLANKTFSRRITIGKEEYLLSVASDDIEKFRLHENIHL